MVTIAAAGDVHASEATRDRLELSFAELEERVDLVLDGIPQPRTVSPWSNGTADVIESAADQ